MAEHSLIVFISHSWKNKLIAEKIYKELSKFCEVWMDYRQLKPGDAIQKTIDKSISSVDLMLLLWSSDASDSENVAKEIDAALRNEKRIIPCFIEYDNNSNQQPNLPNNLQQNLGVEFYHFPTGLARITSYILERNWEHDDEFKNDPRTILIQELDGLMDYLANYRNSKHTNISRSDWIEQILKSFDDYIEAGGNPETLMPLLNVAYQAENNDPQGVGLLVDKLESLLSVNYNQPKKKSKNKKKKQKKQTANLKNKDMLGDLIKSYASKSQRKDWSRLLDHYIESAPLVLNAMQMYCVGVNSPAGCEVVNFLNTYLNNANDLIPDHYGRYGLLDDAWLIHNTCYRLIESNILPANLVMVNWQAIIAADSISRTLIPQEVIDLLDQYVVQMLQLINAEVQVYQPNFGSGFMSGENSFADRCYDVGVESLQNM